MAAIGSPPVPYAQVGLTTLYVGDSAEVLDALPPVWGGAQKSGGSPPYSLGKDYGAATDTRADEDGSPLGTFSPSGERSKRAAATGSTSRSTRTCNTTRTVGSSAASSRVLADVIHLLVREQGWTFNALINWDEGNVSKRTAWGSYGMPTDPWVIFASEAILVLSKGPRKREALGRTWDLLRDEHKDWSLATWKFPGASAKRVGHPSPFPFELPYRMIKLYSFKEDLVIDPWGGSGTTNLAASHLGRPNVYIDLNRDFADLAQGRLERGRWDGARRQHERDGRRVDALRQSNGVLTLLVDHHPRELSAGHGLDDAHGLLDLRGRA